MSTQYAHVFLLNACDKLLTYAIPPELQAAVDTGSIIQVPVRQRREYAIVQSISNTPSAHVNNIKSICSDYTPTHDPYYLSFLDTLCTYYAIDRRIIFRRIRQSLRHKKHSQPEKQSSQEEIQQSLTHEQQHAVDTLRPHIIESQFYPTLLHGVTGSGKTHVYTELTRTCIQYGKVCIWLTPEVTLAIELANRIQRECPDIPCYGFHSATSAREKRAVWHAIHQQEPCVIVGVHLPMLLPMRHLGCIIVDEEHDPGFQEKKHPKINSKEAALLRAHTYGIPIILGSATPSIQALYNVERGTWTSLKLTQRYSGKIAPVTVAHLTKKERRSHFWITRTLENGIRDRLDRGEQTIIFLNRRGYNFFLRCGACGHTFCCTQCSVSLTPHHTGYIQCHYCHRTWEESQQCTSCSTSASHFIRKGIGTQQAVTILQNIFPHARIARADLDTTVDKKKWQATIDAFTNGDIDILVGTQTITKGYDFPNVTLVGLLWADINLGMPSYDTAERTLQQVVQVAGRAGRGPKESHVIAQVMLDHTLFSYAHEDYYPAYYQYEMSFRKTLSYPPYARFAAIELRNEDEDRIESDSHKICTTIQQYITDQNTTLLGPTQPTVSRIEGVHIRMIYIKSPSFRSIHAAYTHARASNITSQIFLTPNASE